MHFAATGTIEARTQQIKQRLCKSTDDHHRAGRGGKLFYLIKAHIPEAEHDFESGGGIRYSVDARPKRGIIRKQVDAARFAITLIELEDIFCADALERPTHFRIRGCILQIRSDDYAFFGLIRTAIPVHAAIIHVDPIEAIPESRTVIRLVDDNASIGDDLCRFLQKIPFLWVLHVITGGTI